jgi:hypothetical protein
MTLELKRISNRSASPDTADRGTHAEKPGSLVINLCKVGVPITIPQPRSPQLRRFSFFLSHSRHGTRGKYRLQMGYFSTHVEANRWLKSLRGIYPGAFVSDVSAAQSEPLSDEEVLRRLEPDPRGTFKETLEILGTIELDVGSEEEINGSGMQDLRIELQKESPLKQISRRLSLWTRKR